ncbi:MAG: SPFH domain-containing protein [Clostridia bacterium]|nr:SPFH domain-containing protein [Clostridia bacterium]
MWFKKSTPKIELSSKNKDTFIHHYNAKMITIVYGTQLIVESGWAAVIVAKNKVLDVFMPGKHEIQLGYIPKTAKALKLSKGKVTKHGKTSVSEIPKKFKCDLYFVSLSPLENRKWQSDYIRVARKKFKPFKFKVKGEYSVTITNPAQLLSLFLVDWGKIANNKALLKLDYLVGEVCSEVFLKKNKITPEELTSKEFLKNYLKPKIDKNFSKYGLTFNNLVVQDLIYPKNYTFEQTEKLSKIEDESFICENKEENKKFADNKQLDSVEENTNLNDGVELLNNFEQRKIVFKDYQDNKTTNLSENLNTNSEKIGIKGLNKCPECDIILPYESSNCPNCGYNLEDKTKYISVTNTQKNARYCQKCGEKVEENALFCKCGCYLSQKDV